MWSLEGNRLANSRRLVIEVYRIRYRDFSLDSANRSREEATMYLGMDVSEYKSVRHPVAAIRKEYQHGHVTPIHRHTRAQLVCAVAGVMTVISDDGAWVVPPNRAVWIPERVDHKVRMSGHVSMRSLYIDKDWPGALSRRFSIVNLTPLARELIQEAALLLDSEGPTPRYDRVLAVIRDQLCAVEREPLMLPLPADPRLLTVTTALLRGGEDRPMKEWARLAGASVRNLHRLFVKETGMGFMKWKQQARFLEALRLLAARQPVSTVAAMVGYESISAFIAAFKKEFGLTPKQYFQQGRSAIPAPCPRRPAR
jgi:AraC-like DNA-binding protein/mannose-6-phosphate isomerase-like protein (cupin superfamily)